MDDLEFDFRIIVIDDNIEIHKDFKKILTKPGKHNLQALEQQLFDEPKDSSNDINLPSFKIDTATQGEEGAALILRALKDQEPYALAFVDIRMPPGWDGIETIINIWKIDPDIQVVICTAYTDYTWEDTIQALGFSENFFVLKKPFDHIALRQLAFALTKKWKSLRGSIVYTKSLEQAVDERTKELKYQATHDHLTGLPNRVLLLEKMHEAIAAYEHHGQNFAILFFDLDRFKLVNDRIGHPGGDEILMIVANRLIPIVNSIGTLFRHGGDDFILLVTQLKNETDIAIIASKIQTVIKQTIKISNDLLNVTTSMGIVVFPQDGDKIESLLYNADVAMYYAKKMGGAQFQFYASKMNEAMKAQLQLESHLVRALTDAQLVLWYQPQINVQNKSLDSVEALIRWNRPSKGMLLPLEFMPGAERSGLMITIGTWIIREACRQNKEWQDKGLMPICMAINIIEAQISQLDFVEKIRTILNETGLNPKYLEIELTENLIVNDSIIEKIKQLREMGIRIALDDFGTGFSSFNNLRVLSLSRIKIDRSFINKIQLNQADEVIICAIIAMAKGLNLEVIAEGVETQNQLDFLRHHECNHIQGYIFSKPLPPFELAKLLESPEQIKNLFKNLKKG
ncbi:MAG: EAL domain-containing protein [Legionella sp.]|nr:EAL domain-containing protein [Legionella sp.]